MTCTLSQTARTRLGKREVHVERNRLRGGYKNDMIFKNV